MPPSRPKDPPDSRHNARRCCGPRRPKTLALALIARRDCTLGIRNGRSRGRSRVAADRTECAEDRSTLRSKGLSLCRSSAQPTPEGALGPRRECPATEAAWRSCLSGPVTGSSQSTASRPKTRGCR